MKVELLAPGGSFESVIAAYNAGADAVYTGGLMFGARAGANNLTTEELIEALEYAHVHDRKLYLTVNTLLKDKEIETELYDYLLPLYENGLDAVIVQDIGVFKFIRDNFPLMHIHASTQMTIFGKDTVAFLKDLGASRIVTPRELSLKEIEDIKNDARLKDMEIESFVHGALCYCYSGQCFMSSYIGGRSGNRGRCAQPCRMEYDVLKDGKVLNPGNNKYVLSPKDICTLKILPEIIKSGVYSLKIEGRMKKTEYITGVVSIYTSLTTFIMVAVLYIMGVSSIREFAAPLMVGIICGAYSSVCITGALWLVMKKKIGGGQAQTVKATAGAAPVKQSVSSAKAPSAPAANGQTQPKKKNRKRVQERLAAQEAAKNTENGSSEEDR